MDPVTTSPPATNKFDCDDELMDPIVDDDKVADGEIEEEEEEIKPSKSSAEDEEELERLEKVIAALYGPNREERLKKRAELDEEGDEDPGQGKRVRKTEPDEEKEEVEDDDDDEADDDDDNDDDVEIEAEEIKPSKLSAEDQERVKRAELDEEEDEFELWEYIYPGQGKRGGKSVKKTEADEEKEEEEDEEERLKRAKLDEEEDELMREMWELHPDRGKRVGKTEADEEKEEVEEEDDYEECNCKFILGCYEPHDEFRSGGLVKQDPVTYKTPEVLLAAQFALDEENKSKERHLEIVEIVEYSCKESSFGGVIKHIILNARDDTVVNAYETVVWVKGDGTFELLVVLTAVPGDKGEAESKEEKEVQETYKKQKEKEVQEIDQMIDWETRGFGVGHGLRVGSGDPFGFQALTAAQFAVEEENEHMNMNLELVAVEKYYYKESPKVGVMMRIFLSARDGPEVNEYDTTVLDAVYCTYERVCWKRLDSTHQIS